MKTNKPLAAKSGLCLLLSVQIAACFVFACQPSGTQAEQRAHKAAEPTGDIVIGIVESSNTPNLFVEGVKLAIDELNENEGILGRPLRAVHYDDEGSPVKGQKIAWKLAQNSALIAVVGHRYSDVAIPASITYEKNGILFISTGASDNDFIRNENKYTFRNIPSDEVTGLAVAEFAKHKGYKKMAVIFDSESSGRRISEIFRFQADKLGIRIVDEKAYPGWEKNFRPLIADLMQEEGFDAIFLGGTLPSAANMIKQIRNMGLDMPIIGSDLIDSPELINIAGKAASGTVVPTVFDPGQDRLETMDFIRKFKSKLGVAPDTWAAQGYDAIHLLAYAIEHTGSTVPIEIGMTLRVLSDGKGVTGKYSIDLKGNVIGKSIFFKTVKDGDFAFLERELMEISDPFVVLKEITLRLPINGAIETIDPGLTLDMASIEITEQLFLGLTDFDPQTYEPVPELATSWTVSKDGKTYRFNMRKDAKWTDGTPVTAHDIVWAVQRNIKPKTDSPYAFMMYIIKNAQGINKGEIKDETRIGVNAVDDFTVEFELEYPAAYFPAMAGLWIYRPLPRKPIESFGNSWTDPQNIVSNGSYKLAAWKKGMVMILRKNPNYYDAGRVSIPEVRYYVIPEAATGIAMYRNDQLDIIGGQYLRVPINEIGMIIESSDISSEYRRTPLFCNYAYAFNTTLPPVDDRLVRKAISAAINRQLLIQVVTRGNQEVATTYTPPPVFGAVDPGKGVGIGFNSGQAKKWLAEAGYPDGKDFPEITLLFNRSEANNKIAAAVKAMLKHYININIKLKALEWSQYLAARVQNFPAAMIIFSWCADYPDANNWLNELFNPEKSENIIGWKNPEFAGLMDQAQKEEDPNKRKRMYYRAEQILCQEESAVVPIYFDTAQYLVKARVKGWYSMALGGQHIRNWYLEQ